MRNIALYLLMFVLGYAYSQTIQIRASVDKPDKTICIDNDIGITPMSSDNVCKNKFYQNDVKIVVSLKEATVVGNKRNCERKRNVELEERYVESISLETIDSPIAYLPIQNNIVVSSDKLNQIAT